MHPYYLQSIGIGPHPLHYMYIPVYDAFVRLFQVSSLCPDPAGSPMILLTRCNGIQQLPEESTDRSEQLTPCSFR